MCFEIFIFFFYDTKNTDEGEFIYSKNPRDLMAGFLTSVVFELGLGDWTANGIPARGQKREHRFEWSVTKNEGSKFSKKEWD